MAERRRREEAIRREEEERERLGQEERRRQYEREREDERQREAEMERRREEERLQYPPTDDMFAEPRSVGGSSKFGVDLNLKKAAPAAAPRVSVFSAESDEGENQTKKRALVPLQYTVEEMMAVGISKEEIEKRQLEEKKKQVQEIINQIPTDPKQLFVYPVPWSMVDAVCFLLSPFVLFVSLSSLWRFTQSLLEKKLKPWIAKKLKEYLGSAEEDFVEFVLDSLRKQRDPQSIVQEVEMVLDKEAETFVVKLWRMLIYEVTVKQTVTL